MAGRRRGAARHRRKKRPLWVRILIVTSAVVLVAGGSAAAAVNILTGKVNDSVDREDLLGDSAKEGADYTDTEGPLNFLMVGTDTRDPDDPDAQSRTDTIMILHIPKGLTQAYLVSVPRDLYVDIPRCWDGVTPCTTKIDAAYFFGGESRKEAFQLLAETMTNLTELEFDGAAIVNFASFKEVVDLVGTVELCLEETITSTHTAKTFEKGCKEYGSEDALDICRQRYQYADGDFARQRMQQRFIKALLAKAEEQGYMSDPTKILTLIEAVGKTLTVQTPAGMDPTDVAYALRNVKPSAMTMVKVPTYSDNIDGQDVEIATDEADGLWEAIGDDGMKEFLAGHRDLVNTDVKG